MVIVLFLYGTVALLSIALPATVCCLVIAGRKKVVCFRRFLFEIAQWIGEGKP
jgi:hypothetical protein